MQFLLSKELDMQKCRMTIKGSAFILQDISLKESIGIISKIKSYFILNLHFQSIKINQK